MTHSTECPVCHRRKRRTAYVCPSCSEKVPMDERMMWHLMSHKQRVKTVERWAREGFSNPPPLVRR